MQKSIYQQICDHLQDGKLEDSFSLPQEQEGVPFAPGALDGIYLYHMQPAGLDAEGAREMGRAVKMASENNYNDAEALFFEWTKKHRAISHIDSLQQYIGHHVQNLNTDNLFHTGLSMSIYSTHIECVKIGLEILELFSYGNKVQEVVRRLGSYDEFTLLSVWNMEHWDNGNDEIFALAKKVRGWGRIHAVERLEPESEEICDWLLREGGNNDVMNAYSSLTCWKKSKAEEILFKTPSQEEYEAISALIEGMLDEGPVKGISGLEDPEGVILRFLSISSNYTLSTACYKLIMAIRTWAEKNLYSSIISVCDDILRSPACIESFRQSEEDIGDLAKYFVN